jgi:hypothetical protein
MFKPIYLIFLLAFLSSCEKSITFKLDSPQPLVVVEASIENGQAPVVILSKSVDYFSKITPQILANSFIRNATVEISNGTKTHRLKEYIIPDSSGYNLYYYSIDSANLGTAFVGELAHNYSLKLLVEGKEYTATTTIPALVKQLDSLWYEKGPPNYDSNFVKLMARTTDPAGYGNYIRYFTKSNREPFWPGLNSVFDDQIIDGKTYNVQVDKGVNRNESFNQETFNLFYKGDTATVKFCNIDKTTFDFWRTMEYSYGSIGNPFSSPTKVLGNIKGGALGYFGGYAAQYISLVIPK